MIWYETLQDGWY